MLEMFLSMFAAVFKSFIKAKLSAMFAAVYAKNPDRHKLLLAELYPVVDVELEDITLKSKTKADDELTNAFKEAIEESAAAKGVTLQNLDAGKPND